VIYDLGITIYDLGITIYDLRFGNYELRITTNELRLIQLRILFFSFQKIVENNISIVNTGLGIHGYFRLQLFSFSQSTSQHSVKAEVSFDYSGKVREISGEEKS